MQQRSADMARYEADKIAFAKRLNDALAEKGIAERGRAGRLQGMLRDAPSRVAISKWLSGDSLPEVKRLGEISQIIGKSVQWMLTGEDSNLEELSDQVGLVPVISWVQAGNFCSNGDIPLPQEVDERIPSPVRVGGRAYAVRVKGDSMVSRDGGRSYPEGTVLIVDPDVAPDAGRRVIARIGDETTFKELVRDAGEWFLKPLNPQYKLIPVTEEVVICGVVRCAVQEE
ncbi:LexA family protein [Aeromonas enteropelogenes]|uniref:LexA family protein n=1 Tax=Aeromonas enteropelogenes TaxID=29489 RepID=UPI003BA21A69